MTFFNQRGFALASLEIKDNTIDFISLVREVGPDNALARITEAENIGLTSGFVSYTLFEYEMRDMLQYRNLADAFTRLPLENRVVGITVDEVTFDLGFSVIVTFDLSFRRLQEIQSEFQFDEDF